MSYFSQISSMYQIFNLMYGILSSSSISSSSSRNSFGISIPVSISVPYMSVNQSKNDNELKDLDFFQMEKLLTWMKFFFEEEIEIKEENKDDNKEVIEITKDDYKESTKETTIKAYKKELYNIYVGIRSDYKQYQHWSKYNNSLWLLSSYRSKNTKDLSKKIISDIQLFNEGLKMFEMINKT
jgi:hypothetical protein